jgi:hypothetical protein
MTNRYGHCSPQQFPLNLSNVSGMRTECGYISELYSDFPGPFLFPKYPNPPISLVSTCVVLISSPQSRRIRSNSRTPPSCPTKRLLFPEYEQTRQGTDPHRFHSFGNSLSCSPILAFVWLLLRELSSAWIKCRRALRHITTTTSTPRLLRRQRFQTSNILCHGS